MTSLRTLLPLLAITAVLTAEEPVSLAALLPPETPAYIESKNPPLEQIKKQALWACMEDPRIKRLIESLSDEDTGLTSTDIPLGSAGVNVAYDIADMAIRVRYVDKSGSRTIRFKESIAAAWIGMAEGRFPVDVVFALGVVGDPADALAVTKRMIAAGVNSTLHGRQRPTIQQTHDSLFVDATHGGVPYTKLSIGGYDMYLGAFAQRLLLASTEARLKDCIDRHAKGPAGSLATSARYTDVMKHARGDGDTTTILVVQVDRTFDTLQKVLPQAGLARGVLNMGGIGGLQTLASVSRVEGRGISNTLSLLMDPNGPPMPPGVPAKHICLGFVPRDAIYFASTTLQLDKYAPMIAMMAGGTLPGGVALKQDVLDHMGSEIAVIVAPNNGVIPDLALVVDVKDGAKLMESLNKLASAIPWPAGTARGSATIGGIKATVLPLGHPRLADFPIAPTFGLIGDKLLIAPAPMTFQRFVSVHQGQRPNISENRDFAKLREMAPADAEGMSYLDLPRLTGMLWDTLMPLLQSIPQPSGSASLYELPESEVFTKHLYGRVAWTKTDERGMHWVSHSPIDGSGFMIGALGMGVATFTALQAEKPQRPRQKAIVTMKGEIDHDVQKCFSNVNQIKNQLRYYRREHGKFPKSLDVLRGDWVAAEVFVVPGTKKKYVYLGPAPRGMVLLHGHPNGKDGKVCVLMRGRMKITRVSETRLKEMLEPQGAKGAK
ncbi:MAG: hypothetical protein ACYTGN_03065 [Planctomycetota bacterium]|jgi:hypothetical protein